MRFFRADVSTVAALAAVTAVALTVSVPAQDTRVPTVRVVSAPKLTLPGRVDSNNPFVWHRDGAAFVLRETAAEQRPSAAPLRLALRAAGPDMLALRVLKRRGPPLESPITLALPPVLSDAARQRRSAERVLPAPALTVATFVDLG